MVSDASVDIDAVTVQLLQKRLGFRSRAHRISSRARDADLFGEVRLWLGARSTVARTPAPGHPPTLRPWRPQRRGRQSAQPGVRARRRAPLEVVASLSPIVGRAATSRPWTSRYPEWLRSG